MRGKPKDTTARTGGDLLATTYYAPAVQAGLTVGTSIALLDAINMTIGFVVPASGKVDVDVQFVGEWHGTNGDIVAAALLNHTGGAQVGFTEVIMGQSAAFTFNFINRWKPRFHLTGLTPNGYLQVDYAMGRTNGSGTSTFSVGVIGSALGPSTSRFGSFLMQAFDSTV